MPADKKRKPPESEAHRLAREWLDRLLKHGERTSGIVPSRQALDNVTANADVKPTARKRPPAKRQGVPLEQATAARRRDPAGRRSAGDDGALEG
jgi:hypothetical protein